jgi:hypothetical protein
MIKVSFVLLYSINPIFDNGTLVQNVTKSLVRLTKDTLQN